MPLTNEDVDTILDRTEAIDGYTIRQTFRLFMAICAGNIRYYPNTVSTATNAIEIYDPSGVTKRADGHIDDNGNIIIDALYLN